MAKGITKRWWFVPLVILGAIGGILFLLSLGFSGIFGLCAPYEPTSEAVTDIMNNINTRFGRISSADFQMEISQFGDCQKEIIEKVKADAIGITNNVQVYFSDAEFKYYWCDSENKVILSSTKMSDIQNYFDSLYKCISDKTTTLFNIKE